MNLPVQLNAIMKKLNVTGVCQFDYFIGKFDITPNKDLVDSVLPRRDTRGGLHWDLLDIVGGSYNSIDIFRALSKGYKITKIYYLYYWKNESKARVFDEYIRTMMKLKESSTKGTAEYITFKAMTTSLYGKTLQRPVIESVEFCYDKSTLDFILKDNNISNIKVAGREPSLDENGNIEKDEYGNTILEESCWYISSTPKTIKEIDSKVTTPAYLGSFILSLSRLMMDTCMDVTNCYTSLKNNRYRGDTDSLVYHLNDYEKLIPFLKSEARNLKNTKNDIARVSIYGNEIKDLRNKIINTNDPESLLILKKKLDEVMEIALITYKKELPELQENEIASKLLYNDMTINQMKKHLIYNEQLFGLGTLDYDIEGKIIYFSEVCPKNYIMHYITKDNEIYRYVKCKGVAKADHQYLDKRSQIIGLGISCICPCFFEGFPQLDQEVS